MHASQYLQKGGSKIFILVIFHAQEALFLKSTIDIAGSFYLFEIIIVMRGVLLTNSKVKHNSLTAFDYDLLQRPADFLLLIFSYFTKGEVWP